MHYFFFLNTELITEKGTPGASSVRSSSFAVTNAFTSDDKYWVPAKDQLPSAIWMRFQNPRRLHAIGYRNFDQNYDPKRLEVIGSDDCTNWTTLLVVENTGFTGITEFRKWTIPEDIRTKFYCFGLRWRSKPPNGFCNAVSEIQMWGYE